MWKYFTTFLKCAKVRKNWGGAPSPARVARQPPRCRYFARASRLLVRYDFSSYIVWAICGFFPIKLLQWFNLKFQMVFCNFDDFFSSRNLSYSRAQFQKFSWLLCNVHFVLFQFVFNSLQKLNFLKEKNT